MTISFRIEGIEEVAAKLNPRQLHGAMTDTLRDLGKEAKADFNRITRTWEHRVSVEVLMDPRNLDLIVGTDDKIFGMLEKGTRPHAIFPKRAKALRFMSGFTPKTTPNSIFSGQGRSFGSVVFRPFVQHPGTKPRNWMNVIDRRLRKKAAHIATKNIERWFKK